MAEEYVVLIVEEEWDPSQVTEAQWTEAMHAHGAFAKAVADAGAQILGGDALQPPSTAVRITPARDGAPPSSPTARSARPKRSSPASTSSA